MKNQHEVPNYLKIVEWNKEDGCFIGSAPPLIGPCCHGQDEAKVFRELCQIVEEWIAIYKKDGRPLPEGMDVKKYSGKFIVRLQPALHRRLAAKARVGNESLNEYLARVLETV